MFDMWTSREKKLLIALAVSAGLLVSTVGYYTLFAGAGTGEDKGSPLSATAEQLQQQGLVTGPDSNGREAAHGAVGEAKGEAESGQSEVVIDVKGAVKKPGIYRLSSEQRIHDALKAAGGATEEADMERLNLADFLVDGMAVYVPRKGEEESTPAGGYLDGAVGQGGNDGKGKAPGQGATATSKVNINRATEAELQTITGIGPAKAAAIVKDRETNGPFKSVDDLTRVSGIGAKTLENIRDQLTVN